MRVSLLFTAAIIIWSWRFKVSLSLLGNSLTEKDSVFEQT